MDTPRILLVDDDLALLEGSELRKDPCSRKGDTFGPVLRGRNQKRHWCNLFSEYRKAWPATFGVWPSVNFDDSAGK